MKLKASKRIKSKVQINLNFIKTKSGITIKAVKEYKSYIKAYL